MPAASLPLVLGGIPREYSQQAHCLERIVIVNVLNRNRELLQVGYLTGGRDYGRGGETGCTGSMLGLRIHDYEVVKLLGEGAMSTVWLGLHTFTGRQAAIKFLRPELLQDESAVARFLDESRVTRAIRHPNVIDITDAGVLCDGRTPYLMMEFLEGESLRLRLQRSRPLPIHEAVEITCQIASALAAAHDLQIVHRDLKPENLYLVSDETRAGQVRVKVLDFGIAKQGGNMNDGSARTQTGALLGTPQYMSPEQCLGVSSGIDHRTDIYALGTILYEMLCGQVPFVREGFGEILIGQIFEDPPSLRTRLPEIPESLERVVLRALAKNPEERFAFMQDFAQAVHEAVPGAARTAKPDEHYAFQPLGAPLLRPSAPTTRAAIQYATGTPRGRTVPNCMRRHLVSLSHSGRGCVNIPRLRKWRIRSLLITAIAGASWLATQLRAKSFSSSANTRSSPFQAASR
jgi:serine/threonine protein kinase